MKRNTFILLCATLLMATAAMAQTVAFPDGKTLFFTNAAGTQPVKVRFYYDKENDAVCTVSAGYQFPLFKLESNRNGRLTFRGYTLSMRYRAVPSPYGGLPMTVPDGMGKDTNNQTLTLSADYRTLVMNGTTYNRRISEGQFNQLYDQIYGNAPAASPGYNGGGGGHSNGSTGSDGGNNYQSSTCKYCHGTGRCSSCNGKGYKFNPYSGEDDRCPSCFGNGRCFNCHGSGRQR